MEDSMIKAIKAVKELVRFLTRFKRDNMRWHFKILNPLVGDTCCKCEDAFAAWFFYVRPCNVRIWSTTNRSMFNTWLRKFQHEIFIAWSMKADMYQYISKSTNLKQNKAIFTTIYDLQIMFEKGHFEVTYVATYNFHGQWKRFVANIFPAHPSISPHDGVL